MAEETLRRLIADVPDFPTPGIMFKDIAPVLADAGAFAEVIATCASRWRDAGITHVVGIESRGFIFGAPLAHALGVGFVMVRKPGKLPRETVRITYDLEYGSDSIEMHKDDLPEGARVLIVDDVLATGGTAAATAKLIEDSAHGDLAGFCFIIELSFLDGRARLPEGARVEALVSY